MPKKHTYVYIKDTIESKLGYILISSTYINSRTKLEIKCPNNHTFYMTFDNFTKGHDCRECANEKRKKPYFTLDGVRNYIESNSHCLLLSNEYTGVNQKLELKCSCGNLFITDFHNFKLGKIKCNKCNGYTDWNIHLIENYLNEENYKLISKTYVKASDKLEMICPKGHICNMSINDFQQNTRCSKCAGNRKYTIEEVKEIIEQEDNYELISNVYINLTSQIVVKCNNNHVYETSLASFKRGCRCSICTMSSGEKSVEKWLIENELRYICQYRFDDCRYKNTLPFDFSVFDNNNNLLCLIEYDGEQHFEPVEIFGGDDNFTEVKFRDEIKNQYCTNNNICLLRIPYWEKENIEKILNNYFSRLC